MRYSCGLIMFDYNNKVLLVKTSKNVFSFPKGKIEDYDDSKYECARREFLEETGMYGFVYKTDLKEIESNINPRKPDKKIIYYTCKMVKNLYNHEINLNDPDGDSFYAEFFSIEDALKELCIEQKRILNEAFQKIKNEELLSLDSFCSRSYELITANLRTFHEIS